MDVIVSIIIPCYNVENYVAACFNSILAGGIDSFEAIFVDDASTDRTVDTVRSLDDARVRLINGTPKGCAGGARNKGIEAASGRYLFFLDADDKIFPGGLSLLVALAEEDGVDVVLGARERVFLSGRRKRGAPTLYNRPARRLRAEDFRGNLTKQTACHGRLYRTCFIKTEGLKFPENQTWEDVVFTFEVWARNPIVSILPETVYEYMDRNDGTQITRQMLAEFAVRDRFSQIDAHFALYNSPIAARCVSRGYDYEIEFAKNLMHHIMRLHETPDLAYAALLCELIAEFSIAYKAGIEAKLDRLDVVRYRLLWQGDVEGVRKINRVITGGKA